MILAFNKPFNVLCQFTPDQPGQRTLAEFGFPPGVYPVGRLDMDSEGLLLLTDEPGFNHRLLDPQGAHKRTYLAQVEGVPEAAGLKTLARGGMLIQGHRTLPARVTVPDRDPVLPPRDPPIRFRKSVPTSWLELTLVEGKNRQVRRMTAAVGLPTLRLIRVGIGTFRADDLAPGQWRELSPTELRRVWNAG